MKLEDDQRVIEFFLERESEEGTKKKYITHLKHYIQHAGDNLTPTELIQEAINEERAGIYIEDRKITQRFLRLKAWLLEQEWDNEMKVAHRVYRAGLLLFHYSLVM
jgi:predicted AlkP superfamily phosphohydrolase/phosphomutase